MSWFTNREQDKVNKAVNNPGDEDNYNAVVEDTSNPIKNNKIINAIWKSLDYKKPETKANTLKLILYLLFNGSEEFVSVMDKNHRKFDDSMQSHHGIVQGPALQIMGLLENKALLDGHRKPPEERVKIVAYAKTSQQAKSYYEGLARDTEITVKNTNILMELWRCLELEDVGVLNHTLSLVSYLMIHGHNRFIVELKDNKEKFKKVACSELDFVTSQVQMIMDLLNDRQKLETLRKRQKEKGSEEPGRGEEKANEMLASDDEIKLANQQRIDKLKSALRKYGSLRKDKIKSKEDETFEINIAVIGPRGSGKSQLINSLLTVAQSRSAVVNDAKSKNSQAAVTTSLSKYKIEGTNISLWDTQGLTTKNELEECMELLFGGTLREGFSFEDPDEQPDFERHRPNYTHEMHAVIFVLDAQELAEVKTMSQQKMNVLLPGWHNMHLTLDQRDIDCLFVVTKIDKIDERLRGNPQQFGKVEGITNLIEDVEKGTDVVKRNIFVQRNYVGEQFNDNSGVELLSMLIISRAAEFGERKLTIMRKAQGAVVTKQRRSRRKKHHTEPEGEREVKRSRKPKRHSRRRFYHSDEDHSNLEGSDDEEEEEEKEEEPEEIGDIDARALKDLKEEYQEMMKELTDKLGHFSEEDLQGRRAGYHTINIALLGPMGVGKSQFINSAITVIQKEHEVLDIAKAQKRNDHVTTILRSYRIRGTNIVLWDLQGIKTGTYNELTNICLGHLTDGYDFSTKLHFEHKNNSSWRKDPTLGNKIHSVMLVVNAQRIALLPGNNPDLNGDDCFPGLANHTQILDRMEIPYAVLVTKLDELNEIFVEKPYLYEKSQKAQQIMEKIENGCGVGMRNILMQKNYTRESRNKTFGIQYLTVKALIKAASMAHSKILIDLKVDRSGLIRYGEKLQQVDDDDDDVVDDPLGASTSSSSSSSSRAKKTKVIPQQEILRALAQHAIRTKESIYNDKVRSLSKAEENSLIELVDIFKMLGITKRIFTDFVLNNIYSMKDFMKLSSSDQLKLVESVEDRDKLLMYYERHKDALGGKKKKPSIFDDSDEKDDDDDMVELTTADVSLELFKTIGVDPEAAKWFEKNSKNLDDFDKLSWEEQEDIMTSKDVIKLRNYIKKAKKSRKKANKFVDALQTVFDGAGTSKRTQKIIRDRHQLDIEALEEMDFDMATEMGIDGAELDKIHKYFKKQNLKTDPWAKLCIFAGVPESHIKVVRDQATAVNINVLADGSEKYLNYLIPNDNSRRKLIEEYKNKFKGKVPFGYATTGGRTDSDSKSYSSTAGASGKYSTTKSSKPSTREHKSKSASKHHSPATSQSGDGSKNSKAFGADSTTADIDVEEDND